MCFLPLAASNKVSKGIILSCFFAKFSVSCRQHTDTLLLMLG